MRRLRWLRVTFVDLLAVRQPGRGDIVMARGWGRLASALRDEAAALGVVIEHETIFPGGSAAGLEDIVRRPGTDAVAACALYTMHVSWREPSVEGSATWHLMKLLERLKPDILVAAEESTDLSLRDFAQRFPVCLRQLWRNRRILGHRARRTTLAVTLIAYPMSDMTLFYRSKAAWHRWMRDWGFREVALERGLEDAGAIPQRFWCLKRWVLSRSLVAG